MEASQRSATNEKDQGARAVVTRRGVAATCLYPERDGESWAGRHVRLRLGASASAFARPCSHQHLVHRSVMFFFLLKSGTAMVCSHQQLVRRFAMFFLFIILKVEHRRSCWGEA